MCESGEIMKVKLLSYTPNPDKLIAAAARVCYDKDGNIEQILEGLTEEKINAFLQRMMQVPQHGSVWEHPSFTFGIEGISRATTHQLVRHRIASYDQRSQRYCNEIQFEYVMPDSIKAQPATVVEFNRHMQDVQSMYDKLINKYNIPKEDARAVLPNACVTSIIVTMNVRTLFHFFALRCCTRAQKEIRELANKMLELCKEVAPLVFSKAGASCKQLGYCPEGHMSCGAYPTLEQVLANYKK